MKKIALIFGVNGQDGSYLAKLLLSKKYKVHGVIRRSSIINTIRLSDIYEELQSRKKFYLHYGDLLDSGNIYQLINKIQPDEIYNLAAQSHVGVSFKIPVYTANVNALGTLRILEAIKEQKKKMKFYQAGTSEMFGNSKKKYQNEKTSFQPESPYAAAKVFSHHMVINYRNSYKIFASNGILFNHESPVRGETFVTRKIIKALVRIKYNKQKILYLGNIYSKRDWGHAKDYVLGMWKILQYKKPDDFVLSTGNTFSVKYFINKVAKKLKLKIKWVGKGLKEKAYLMSSKKIIIKIDKQYFRPTEVNYLRGESAKARRLLNWCPNFNLNNLIDEMLNFEKNKINEKN
jgi:GDPmannose 4,6-dehydratase